MDNMVPLTYEADAERVLDLMTRADDYVRLETGRAPDMAFVRESMIEAPPVVRPEDIHCWGYEGPDGALMGFAASLKGFYEPQDWYMGLLILDPATRGQGLGTRMARFVMDQAQTDGAPVIRIAVLDANTAGRRFWERMGYVHAKSFAAADMKDGHARHVLEHRFGGADAT